MAATNTAPASQPFTLRVTEQDLNVNGAVVVQIVYGAREDWLNSNNVGGGTLHYRVLELDSLTDVPMPVYNKSLPMCDMCLRTFPNFSTLYKHKGSLCISESDTLEHPHPVRIAFEKHVLPFIQDGLTALHKDVIELGDGKSLYFVHEKEFVPLIIRKLYTLQTTKYNLERWYKWVSVLPPTDGIPATAPTIFLPLTDQDLTVLRGLCTVALAEGLGMPARLKQSELDGRQSIEDRLGAIMQPGKKYFCRMSTRSPKDAVSLTEEEKKETDPSRRLLLKYRHMCVTDPFYAVELLSKSQRVFSDISFFFQYRIPGTSSDELSIILRDWVDQLPQDHEFRCFVSNGVLTAISQYHCYVRFPSLIDNTEYVARLREAIVQYHNFVKPHIQITDYVIDIVVLPGFHCQVIELNPFGPTMSSGSALFDWTRDLELLCGRQPPRGGFPAIRILGEILHDSE